MRFQCRWRTANYVVKAGRTKHNESTGHPERVEGTGIRADFKGAFNPSGEPLAVPGFFDSSEAQRANGWTEDERLMVERYLLTHSDFGTGLYLAAGETIPPEHADLNIGADESAAPADPVEPTGTRCMLIRQEGPGKTWQCSRIAKEGEDYCAQHLAKLQPVS